MNTRGEIKSRLKRELEMVDTSTIFTDATLEDAIWDAYLWATDRHPFPKLERAKNTVTGETNGIIDYYYDSPAEFKADSIFLVTISDQEYTPTEFEDYLAFKRNYPNNVNDFIFSQYADQYFIDPVPTAINLPMTVWGLIQPPRLTTDGQKTIFSDSEESLNEGIMRKALSDLVKDMNESNTQLLKAQAIIDGGFSKIIARRYRYKRKDAPFFDVPDMFGSQVHTPGNFRYRPR